MATANEILHDPIIIFASYLTLINIPDVHNAESQAARDKAIEDFKEDIAYRLTSEIQLLVGSALFIYTYFDTQDEEVRLKSWQDKTEAITGTLAAIIEAIKTRVEYLCNKAKACEFADSSKRMEAAHNLIGQIEENVDHSSLAADDTDPLLSTERTRESSSINRDSKSSKK